MSSMKCGSRVAAGPGDLRGITSAWSPGDAKFADKMNGDAGALAYSHRVKTSEAQYGDLHTIHTLTFAERFTLQRAQAVGLLRRDVRRRPRVARSSMIASKIAIMLSYQGSPEVQPRCRLGS